MNLREAAECVGTVALGLLAELALRVTFRFGRQENIDAHFDRLPHIESLSYERAYRDALDAHNFDITVGLFNDDSIALTRQLIVIGADARVGPDRRVDGIYRGRFDTIGHFRAVYESGAFRNDPLRWRCQDSVLCRTVERDNAAMCRELIRLIGSPVDYTFGRDSDSLWEYAVRTSGAANLCYEAMQAFPTTEFPVIDKMPMSWHNGTSTREMCASRDKKLLADIAIGLAELDLPVNLLMQFFAVHLASCRNTVPPAVQWEIAKQVKQFGVVRVRRSDRMRIRGDARNNNSSCHN